MKKRKNLLTLTKRIIYLNKKTHSVNFKVAIKKVFLNNKINKFYRIRIDKMMWIAILI
jgi:hypothetical protein